MRGWILGAWDGRGSTGTAVGCGDGTGSSAAAARSCGSCRSIAAPSSYSPTAAPARALYRSLFPILMQAWFGIAMPALRLDSSPGAAGDLARFAGVYAWPDL